MPKETHSINRRQFVGVATATAAGLTLSSFASSLAHSEEQGSKETFKLRYMLASSMYGYTDIAQILPEVHKAGATAIDIWPKKHGNQREQLDKMGEEKFAALLKKHKVSLGCITQFKLGVFNLQEEMRLANRMGCSMIISAVKGQRGLKGKELKAGVRKFVEKMKPHLDVAEENNVTIAIENHANNLIESPDSLKWLAELRPSKHLSIAFAPYHLKQDSEMLGKLIRELGNSITMFYAWQHGLGSKKPLPKNQELMQLPGRGELDFAPLLKALQEINYKGWTEIFMHPFPRGKAIMPTTAKVTEEINQSRKYISARIE